MKRIISWGCVVAVAIGFVWYFGVRTRIATPTSTDGIGGAQRSTERQTQASASPSMQSSREKMTTESIATATTLPATRSDKSGIVGDSANGGQINSATTTRNSAGSVSVNSAYANSQVQGFSATATSGQQMRQVAEQTYAPFFDARSVDPATREKVIDATVAFQSALRESISRMLTSGGTPADIAPQRAEASARYQKQISELLGPDGVEALNQFGYMQPFVPIAQDFASRCASQGTPLTAANTMTVASIFSQNLVDPSYTPPTQATAQNLPQYLQGREAAAFAQAEKVLTPRQMEIFKRMWAEHPWPARP